MARQNNYPIFENNSTVITAEFLNGLVNNVKTLNQEDGVFDISIANAVSGVPTTYNSLELALSGTNIPVDIRKGGMGVKFINSGTGKYEQWNLKASSWSTDTSDWALDVDGSVTDGKLKLSFEMERPNENTPVTNTSEIDHGNGSNKQSLDGLIDSLKNNEVVIDLTTNTLTYKNQTFIIIGVDDGSASVGFVLGTSRLGYDEL